MGTSKPTIEDIAAALTLSDDILERALWITSGAPYFMFCDEAKFARINIDASTATLRWPEAHSGYYESCSIEEQSVSFPAELLLMTRTQIGAWKTDQSVKHDLAEKEKAAQQAKAQEAQERALLAQLQRKYQATRP